MTSLPNTEDQHRPLYRILVARSWSEATAGAWEELPMAPRWDVGRHSHGFEVEDHERSALPQIGQARFLYHFGRLNNRVYGFDSAGGARDLYGYFVRIQAAEAPVSSQRLAPPGFAPLVQPGPFYPVWGTVWLGRVEQQADNLKPGSNYPIGTRVYHCKDIIAVADRWPMTRHVFQFDGGPFICRAHPGYNRALPDGTLQGNKGSACTVNGSTTFAITQPGQGDLVTDMDAVNDAIICNRGANDPQFLIALDGGLLQSAQHWAISEGMTVLGFLMRALRRQRGRGIAYVNWSSDVGNPKGPLSLFLTVVPQTAADIQWTDPSDGSSQSIVGAQSFFTYWSVVDLIGDQRNVDTNFSLGTRYANKYDYVETVGEQIEVLVTLSYQDLTLEERWPVAEEFDLEAALSSPSTMWDALSTQKYEATYQLHSPPVQWPVFAGNGEGSSIQQVDVRCADDGSFAAGSGGDTSPVTVTIARDSMVVSAGDSALGIVRGQPSVWLFVATGKWIEMRSESPGSLCIRRDNGLLVKGSGDEESGFRSFSRTAVPVLGALTNYTSLAFTVTLRLPHRVRVASGNPNGRRLPPIYLHGQVLWVAHRAAIWSLNMAAGDPVAGHSPNREYGNTASGNFRIVRDNRSTLARIHALAWSWYGSERRTASWQLRAIGSMGSYIDGNGNTAYYPYLGYVVGTLLAGGLANTLNTPITSVHVNVRKHVTTWTTDWSDLDLK